MGQKSWRFYNFLWNSQGNVCPVISFLVSSVQKSLSFSFLHFLCIFSEDISTFGKDISRLNLSFFRFQSRKYWEKKSDWQGFFFTKREEKGQNMLKNKGFWQDRTNLAKSLWSRSLLRQKRRPWSSKTMTQGLQNYYIAWFIQLRKDKRNCPEEDKSNLLKQCASFPLDGGFLVL